MADEKAPEATEANPQARPEEDIQEMTSLHERTIATMSYIGFLAIVPFYLKKDSKFCRFHGKQGLLIAILFFFATPLYILPILADLLYAAQFGIFLYMGMATLSGKWKRFPWIYKTACTLEDQLSLKTKEEEEEAARLRPDEVQSESEAEGKPTEGK
jgi:uncharacterized membrane protein